MATKCPMSPSSSRFIEPWYSHHPFTFSPTTTNLISTPSRMQITNYPLAPLTIITNHASPTSSPYWSLTFHANVGSQPYTFPNPFDNALVGPFSPFHLFSPYNCPWSNPPTYPHFPDTLATSTKIFLPHLWASIYHLKVHLCSYYTSNSSNPNPCDHPICISLGLGFNIGCPQVLLFKFLSFLIIELHFNHSMAWCTNDILFSIG
jgi:hypothetical protein